MPLSMSRIAHKLVTVCELLTNFQPVLIPSLDTDLSEVEEYIKTMRQIQS